MFCCSSLHISISAGCLHLGANIEATTELCVTSTKYVFLVRDLADMLWAAYNYWCIAEIDEHCVPGGRTTATSLRSPEHFHSWMVAKKSLGGGTPMQPSGLCYQPDLIRAVSAFGRSNVIVLRSEDLQSNSASTARNQSFSSLRNFLQLEDIPRSHEKTFNVSGIPSWTESVLRDSKVVNAGHSLSSRGEFVESLQGDSVGGGRYEASGFRPMLRETRRLLYVRWRVECLWLRQKWSLAYSACVD